MRNCISCGNKTATLAPYCEECCHDGLIGLDNDSMQECPDMSVLADIEAEEAFWAHTPDQGDVDNPAEPYFPPLEEGQDDPLPF